MKTRDELFEELDASVMRVNQLQFNIWNAFPSWRQDMRLFALEVENAVGIARKISRSTDELVALKFTDNGEYTYTVEKFDD